MTSLTIKQEAFAQTYVENGGNASDAYRKAYSAEKMTANAIGVEAHRLLMSPKVALRIQELRESHAKRHEVTIDLITEKLWKAEQLAYETENPSAAVSAVMGAAKVHGLIVDKVKGETTIKRDPSEMTDAELAAIAAAGSQRAADAEESAPQSTGVH